MLKRLASWKYGITIAVILGCSIYVSHQDQKIRDRYEQKCAQLNASTISPAPHQEDCEKGAENAARHLPHWYRVFGWPEGITTWAILLTLLVIADQTAQTRRAADATRDSVEAAKRQADLMERTLVLQFRPKIVVRCGDIHVSTVAPLGDLSRGTLDFTIANTGGSNAKVLTCEVEVLAFITPPSPMFCHSHQFQSFELKPGESIPHWADLRGEVNEAIRWANLQQPGTIGRSKAKHIYFVGVIWYGDDIGTRRSMAFSRRYDPDAKRFIEVLDPDREYSD
jgi:hypothetical protein